MTYTAEQKAADLAELERAMARGVRSVEMNGEKVTYRLFADIERTIARLRREIGTGRARHRSHYPKTSTGFR